MNECEIVVSGHFCPDSRQQNHARHWKVSVVTCGAHAIRRHPVVGDGVLAPLSRLFLHPPEVTERDTHVEEAADLVLVSAPDGGHASTAASLRRSVFVNAHAT